MKTITLAAVAVLMSAGAALAADPLEGHWRTAKDDNGHSGLIRVKPCGAQLCGTLIKAYDAAGNVISYIDARDQTWQLTYNNAGWLIEVVNPNGVPTAYDYDSAGRIIRVRRHVGTPVETVEAYARDANGNITRYVGPDGVVATYQYDQNDRLLRAVLAVDTPAEAQFLFEYNDVGQLTRAEDPSGSATRTHPGSGSGTR